jgi:hypothetical protein
MDKDKRKLYRNGGDGFIQWCEDNVLIPIYPEGQDVPEWCPMNKLPTNPHPETGKSYRTMWESQKSIYREALQMENGRFKYRLIILCWMRGEGKSLDACLIQLWKFFCWLKQNIVLGANSKDQVKFVHFEVMSDIILNSPKLLAAVGKRNVQQKEIRLKNARGDVVSTIRALSSFTGIVSNITGYTFSEMHSMKDPRFFVQLDGSIRNIPNAIGVIDTTVAPKTHVLYKMYQSHLRGKLTTAYYSYRSTEEGKVEDFWNPNMTTAQLEDYREKFPFGEFERYFLNLWSAGKQKIFTEEMIQATEIAGVDGRIGGQKEILKLLTERNRIVNQSKTYQDQYGEAFTSQLHLVDDIESRFTPVSNYYNLSGPFSSYQMATIDDLHRLSDLYDTDWSILVGIDRADPMKVKTSARTSVVCLAKGLPGSRSNPYQFYGKETVPLYLYIVLHLTVIADSSLDGIKDAILACHEEFDGIDSLEGERWGLWDISKWCEEHEIVFEAVYPNYEKQKEAFAEFYTSVQKGMFKCAPIVVPGYKEDNILFEEMDAFDHDVDKKWFGSQEKGEKDGIQDDVMYGIGWGMHGGRKFGVDDFRSRGKVSQPFGLFFPDRSLLSYNIQ